MLPMAPPSPEIKIRKMMGRTYLNENRLEEALSVFCKILDDHPDDIEALMVLGNMYLASGDGNTAGEIYRQARNLEPENPAIQRQIMLAKLEGSCLPPEPSPTHADAITRLLERLVGEAKAPITEEKIERATQMMENILQSEDPVAEVASHLHEIDELLPALIELNIRQAQEEGRLDIVEDLRNVQKVIQEKFGIAPPGGRQGASSKPVFGTMLMSSQRFSGRVLILLPYQGKCTGRMLVIKMALESQGCQVEVTHEFRQENEPLPDVAIVSNPHIMPALLESMAALVGLNIPLILDLDHDFEKMPVTHPHYNQIGLGSPVRGRAFTAALLLASLVTSPSEILVASLRKGGHSAVYLPDGWTRSNMLWEKKTPARTCINIGWMGQPGQVEDLVSIRRIIIRVLREFSNTQVVVSCIPQAYRLFDSVPENRRMYLPLVESEEKPFLISQFDILMVPLLSDPYNLSLPDTILVEAGVRRVPWVASKIPSFVKWQAGGIICENLDEWHMNLRQLVIDKDMRRSLGQAGYQAARERELYFIGKRWLEAIEKVLATRSSEVAQKARQAVISGASL